MLGRKGNALFILLLSIILMVPLSGCTQEVAYMEGISPIIDQEGADPSILKKDGMYYYTKTTGNNVTLYRSVTLTDVAAGEIQVVYDPENNLTDLWAPEIQFLDNAWYIYFAATLPGDEIHHMYYLKNENPDPFTGAWKCDVVKGMDDKFAIDGVVLEVPEGKYFIWSGWEGYENVQQNLYLAEMISPTEVKEEKILLSEPEYNWERQGDPLVNEGPEILIRGDMINLVYSASGSWTDDYCLGLLTARVGDDLKNPEAWEKKKTPVMASANGVFGPGHNGFTVSDDDKQLIIIYHAARWQGAGWSRSVRFGYLEFEEDGRIAVMEPASSRELIPIPSRESARQVYLSDRFTLTGEVALISEEGTVSNQAAAGFLQRADEVSVTIECQEDSQKILYVYAKLPDTYDDALTTLLQIHINGENRIAMIYPSEYYQPIPIKATLKKGKNKIIISSETGGSTIHIDRIEVQN